MRYWSVILLMGAAAGSAASEPPVAETAAHWERLGRSLFLACEFKQATRAFKKGLADHPQSAVLQYWLGKSYVRLAEISNPLLAPKNARKARRSLEQAVKLDPQNNEYLRELFEFYLDSPEWSSGGLKRAAALLERTGTGESGAESQRKQLADSRLEHSGVGWWMRWAVLRTSAAVGYFVPQP